MYTPKSNWPLPPRAKFYCISTSPSSLTITMLYPCEKMIQEKQHFPHTREGERERERERERETAGCQ